MEEQREGQAQDYWLIQFQRLLDSKPQVLVDAVSFFHFTSTSISDILTDLQRLIHKTVNYCCKNFNHKC